MTYANIINAWCAFYVLKTITSLHYATLTYKVIYSFNYI